jgi:hypothetical protein
MAAERTRWSDERLDDDADRLGRLEANVDQRFDKVDRQFEKADAAQKAGFAAVKVEIAVVSAKMDKMNRAMVSGLVTILAAVVGKFLIG